LPKNQIEKLDYYEQLKLSGLIQACRQSKSMAEAGRTLFNISRLAKKSTNDSHRVKQLLDKYQLKFEDLQP
ncbi:MAG: sigma 54-dependent transcriptional regulator, partial [Cellvibrionaceae bacterium]|nr:sigma 54-dependent transcriptional regulator [Cellvibrionaceae bacterium]